MRTLGAGWWVVMVVAVGCGQRPPTATVGSACDGAAASAAERNGFLFRALASLGPECPDATATRARILDALGRDDEALLAYRALPPSPHTAERIRVIEARPRLDAASLAAISADDRSAAALLYREGARLRIAGDHDQAVEVLRSSYARWPHPLTIVQIGLAHRAAGRAVEAQISFERALAIAERIAGGTAVPMWTPRHAGSIDAMVYDPSGRLLATAGADGQVLLWEPVTGQLLRRLVADTEVGSVAFSADGSEVVILGPQRVVAISTDDGAVLRDVAVPAVTASLSSIGAVAFVDEGGAVWLLAPGSTAPMRLEERDRAGTPDTDVVQFSGDGTRLLQVASDEFVVWNAGDGTRIASVARGEQDFQVELDTTGAAILVAGDDGFVRLDVATGARTPILSAAPAFVIGMRAPAADRVLLDLGGQRQLWDARADRALLRVGGPGFNVTSTALHPRGDVLAAGATEGEIRLFDVTTGKPIRTLGGDTWGINDVSFDATGERLLISSDDGSVKVWKTATRAKLPSIWAHYGWVVFARMSDDGTRVVTGGKDQKVHVWDMVARKKVRTLSASIRGKGNSAVDTTRDGSAVVATFDGHLRNRRGWVVSVLPLDGGRPRSFSSPALRAELSAELERPIAPLPLTDAPRTVTLSPDGKRLALGTDEGDGGARVLVVDIASGRKVSLVSGLSDNVTACAFAPDGATMAIASAATTDGIALVTTESGARLATLPTTGRDHVVELGFSPDGARLVAVGRDHTVRVFDVATRALTHTLRAHEAVVTGVAFAPSGAWFATASKDRSVRVWDTSTAALRATLRPTRAGDWVVVTPDGRLDGTPGGVELIDFEVGPFRLPGFVGWDRAREPGLLERLTADGQRRDAR